MRVRSLVAWAIALLPCSLVYCGSSADLQIGRVDIDLPSEAGPGDSGAAGAAGEGGAGGDPSLPVAGAAGQGGEGGAAGAPGVGGAACIEGDAPSDGILLHRYSFEGTSAEVVDTIADANGSVVGGALLDGSGTLTLDGNDDFVDLPNGLISGLEDVTFVVWTSWSGGAGFQRIFDFGVSRLGEGESNREQGDSYIALIPFNGSAISAEARTKAQGTVRLITTTTLVQDVSHQLALIVRGGELMELYLDAALIGSIAISMSPTQVSDLNDWLGQSQWAQDHTYNGSYDEFRIYGEALSSCEIQTLYEAGPDTLPP